MTPRDRAFRKELLLVKGDALRMQVRTELDIIRNRMDIPGLLMAALRSGSRMGSLFSSAHAKPEHGWRAWLSIGSRAMLAWQALQKILSRL